MMKQILLTLACLWALLPSVASAKVASDTTSMTSRPKIAVVLAGGGAKGVAHVAALKAIEEAGIPIDLVVGTSIGSIVGGMYCTGYSPDTMRTIIGQTDWIKMIADNPDFGNTTLSSKKADESFALRFSLDQNRLRSGTGRGGVIHGTNVIRFFRNLTRFLPDSLDFSDMPIPFACVGTNAVSGERKVFTSGNVAMAMRASMAIPTVFTPVTIDSAVYVDGGVCDNFPVDVAREMGADIVIGVDLKVQIADGQLTNSAIDLLMNCVDLYSQERYKQNVANADIYIPIDVTGYSAASFGPEALDTLMCRGDHYASLKKHSLDSLRQTLHLDEEPYRIRVGEYSFARSIESTTSWNPKEEQETRRSLYLANDGSMSSSVAIGGRFDNQEFATLLFRTNIVLSKQRASLLVLQARLGTRLEGKVDYSQRTFGTQRFGLSYKYQQYDIGLNSGGRKVIDLDMRHNKFNLYFTQEWHNIKYTFGLNFNDFRYDDVLLGYDYAARNMEIKSEKFFSYYIKSEVNTFDYQYFPSRGHLVEVSADLVTDNLIAYQDKRMLPIFSAKLKGSYSISERLNLQPHLFARIMMTKDIDEPLSLMNIIGGMFSEQHFIQQQTMAGLHKMELIREDGLGIVGITAQASAFKNHYIVLTTDVCTHANRLSSVLKAESLNWGVEASYNIRTAVGPVGIKAGWNDLNRRFNVTLNAGFYF